MVETSPERLRDQIFGYLCRSIWKKECSGKICTKQI